MSTHASSTKPQACSLPADAEVRRWIAHLERRLFRNPLDETELAALHGIGAARIAVYYDPQKPIGRETRVGYSIGLQWPSRFELRRIAVAPRLQGRGYGRAMLESLADHCRRMNATIADMPRVIVEVREEQAAERRFFMGCGFQAIAVEYWPAKTIYQLERRVDGRRPSEFAVFDYRGRPQI